MNFQLNELIRKHYDERDAFSSSAQADIVSCLKSFITIGQTNEIQDLLKDDAYDNGIDRKVDLSWINNITSSTIDEKSLRINGLIRSYKEAGDSLVLSTMGGPSDFMFQPIMFCYMQYLELLLKNYKAKISRGWSLNSHNPVQIWNAVKNDICTYLNNTDDYMLLDSIINCMFGVSDSSMSFRYLEDMRGSWYIDSASYKVNLYSVKILMDIIDDILIGTYEGDLRYEGDS